MCLQELWIHDEFELVRDQVLQVLPFSRFFHTYVNKPIVADSSGALGSGLAIFTRYPIVAAQAFPYALSGLPLHVLAGDFFVNKAAGYVVVLHPILGEIEVWNTHVSVARGSVDNRCMLPAMAGQTRTRRTGWRRLGSSPML